MPRDARRECADGVGARGPDRGVRVAEAADKAGEDFGEEGGERVAVGVGERGHEVHALLANGGFVGGVGGVDAREEDWNRVRVQGARDGLELVGSCDLCVAI